MPKNELILHENTQSATEGTISAEPEIDTPSAILMEASTGQIIYEKAADEQLPPASVTKVMTLLLIFDCLLYTSVFDIQYIRMGCGINLYVYMQ